METLFTIIENIEYNNDNNNKYIVHTFTISVFNLHCLIYLKVCLNSLNWHYQLLALCLCVCVCIVSRLCELRSQLTCCWYYWYVDNDNIAILMNRTFHIIELNWIKLNVIWMWSTHTRQTIYVIRQSHEVAVGTGIILYL